MSFLLRRIKRYKREGSKKPSPRHRPQGLVNTTYKKINGVRPSKGVGCISSIVGLSGMIAQHHKKHMYYGSI